MNRWIVAVVGGILVLGVLVKLGVFSSAAPEPAGSAPAKRATASSNLSPVEQRLLTEDSLPPPPPDAPESEWRIYEKMIEAIRAGQDPLKARMESTRDEHEASRKEREAERREISTKRMEERRRAAEERHKEIEARHDAIREKMRRIREEHRANAPPEWANQTEPKEPPLFTPPPAPPAVTGVEPRETAQPPGSTK